MVWRGLNLFITVLLIVMMISVVMGGMIVCLMRFLRGVEDFISGF